MSQVKFYQRKPVPVEMHKVKIVQKLSLLPASERLHRMEEAGFNTFKLHNGDIFMDMLTDSGVNAMSDNMQAAMLRLPADTTQREIKERVPYVLNLVGLSSKEHRHPGELSGGEQQRLAIARALINNPSTIIADEPTGNLDPQMSFEIMSLLQEINNLGTTMLVVTHAQDLVNRFGKRTITINDGLIVSDEIPGGFGHENQ